MIEKIKKKEMQNKNYLQETKNRQFVKYGGGESVDVV